MAVHNYVEYTVHDLVRRRPQVEDATESRGCFGMDGSREPLQNRI